MDFILFKFIYLTNILFYYFILVFETFLTLIIFKNIPDSTWVVGDLLYCLIFKTTSKSRGEMAETSFVQLTGKIPFQHAWGLIRANIDES